MQLRIAHLYPDMMNIYGDRGNVIVLRQRCAWRGIDVEVTALGLNDHLDPDAYDLLFVGGGQDRDQQRMASDLRDVKSSSLLAAAERRCVIFSVCGGYQLLGKFYRSADGEDLPGVGLFDAWTVHTGPRTQRCIGNVVVRCDWDPQQRTLVGFENHGGRTYLGRAARPLGVVVHGFGNNAEDGSEGIAQGTAYGTYLHGSLLPKNPWFADHLVQQALQHRYGKEVPLADLDDALERTAHTTMERAIQESGRRHGATPRT